MQYEAAKKYKLDAPSACKLAEVLECRDDPETDLRQGVRSDRFTVVSVGMRSQGRGPRLLRQLDATQGHTTVVST